MVWICTSSLSLAFWSSSLAFWVASDSLVLKCFSNSATLSVYKADYNLGCITQHLLTDALHYMVILVRGKSNISIHLTCSYSIFTCTYSILTCTYSILTCTLTCNCICRLSWLFFCWSCLTLSANSLFRCITASPLFSTSAVGELWPFGEAAPPVKQIAVETTLWYEVDTTSHNNIM